MWITGNDAINRFDGNSVKVYNLDRFFKNCPPIQQGYGFAEDPDGNLYIGSAIGLYKYIRNEDRFTLIKVFPDASNDAAMPFACYGGRIWCYNLRYQVAVLDLITGEARMQAVIPIPLINSIHIYNNRANCFYNRWPFIDEKGNAWFIGVKRIISFNTVTGQLQDYTRKFLPDDAEVYCSAYDKRLNRLLLGTDKGLFAVNLLHGVALVKYKEGNTHANGIACIGVAAGYYALRTMSSSLVLVSSDNPTAWTIERPLDKYARTGFFGFDKSGRLWMNDDGQGYIIIDFKKPLLPKLPNHSNRLPSIEALGVGGFCEMPDGKIWVEGKIVFDPRTEMAYEKKLKHCKITIGRQVVFDKFRNLYWCINEKAVFSNSVFYLDTLLGVHRFLKRTPGNALGEPQDIKVLADGRVLCSYSNGLFWLDTKGFRLEKVPGQPYINAFVINQLIDNKIAISYLNNDMWLAECLPGQPLRFVKRILPGVQSFYMLADEVRQQYWVGGSNGVYLLDSNYSLLRKFDANNGLAGTYIYGLLADDEGNIWCSHQRGLSSISTGFTITNYDKQDGIQDWDYNNRAFLKSKDGTLYFGGVKGFNYFKPPLKHELYYKPVVYIDEILVANRVYRSDINADMVSRLDLKNNEKSIIIKALIRNLSGGDNNQLTYRIKETSSTWIQPRSKGIINLTSLSPGMYTLELGIYDKFADSYLLQKTITISIAVPFYRSRLFFVLTAIVLTALIVGLYSRYRLIRQSRAYTQQLALEQQRQKITADLHDDIGASLSSLQLNSAVANRLIDKDLTQAKLILRKIAHQSRKINERIGDIIWSLKPGKEEFISLDKRIKIFANELLDGTDIHYEILIDAGAEKAIIDMTARKNTLLICKEALNNAVKYSKASHLCLEMIKQKKTVVLKISDNGCGISPESISGNGLLNMKKRAIEMCADYRLHTEEQKGTIITVSIPVP